MLLRIALLSLLFLPIAFAACEDDLAEIDTESVFRDILRTRLYDFLSNPNSSQNLNMTELKAAVTFYVTYAGNINATTICSESATAGTATYEGVVLESAVKKMIDTDSEYQLPRCADGTPYGACSKRQPLFCSSGRLVPRCAGPDMNRATVADNCGCPAGSPPCLENTGRCVECAADDDCEKTTYFCDGQVKKEKIEKSYCSGETCGAVYSSSANTITDCSPWQCIESGDDAECVECKNPNHCDVSFCYSNSIVPYICNNSHQCQADYANALNCGALSCLDTASGAVCSNCAVESDCTNQVCVGSIAYEETCNLGNCEADLSSPVFDCGSQVCVVNSTGQAECTGCNSVSDCPEYLCKDMITRSLTKCVGGTCVPKTSTNFPCPDFCADVEGNGTCVECLNALHCPTFTCVGNDLYTGACVNYSCSAGTLEYECADFDRYCAEGHSVCVNCNNDTHCADVYTCEGPRIMETYCDEHQCKSTGIPKNYCTGASICVPGCAQCIPDDYPRTSILSAASATGSFNITVDIIGTDLNSFPRGYQFTNISIEIYRNSVYMDTLQHEVDSTCYPTGCLELIPFNLPAGDYRMLFYLHNYSGNSWVLRKSLSTDCEANISVSVGT